MKKFNKNLIVNIFVVSLVLCLAGPITTLAATTPDLGTAATFGILTGTFNHDIATTTITGVAGTNALGYTDTFGVGAVVVTGNTITAGDTYAAAGDAQGTALTALSATAQPCGNGTTILGYTFDTGVVNLATNTERGGTTGHYSPGVYCITGAMNIGTAGIVLDTPGTYIFRSTGAFDTADTSTAVTLGTDVSACDVFWVPGAATTIHANNTFVGTVIDNAGITISHLVTWLGRALAYNAGSGVVTADTTTLTLPTCASVTGTCGTAAKSYLYTDVAFAGTMCALGSKVTTPASPTFPTQGNSVTWTCGGSNGGDSSGICTASRATPTAGGGGNSYIPTVPPFIDVVKVPSPLALPAGPGAVTYTYTVRNIGTVPMINVTVVDNKCSPMVFVSGDTNANSKLDISETWTYDCFNTLSETTTNTVTVMGWANGISAVDIANATVVVGVPIIPPLIHVTKIPSPLTLSAAGGMVTYTYTVTNPGTVPLSNVTITDDKCTGLPGRVIGHPGDINKNNLLESNESWVFTCQSKLTKTTTNIGTASGDANGITAKDFAIATVVVAAPALPNTGFNPNGKWNMAILLGVIMLISFSAIVVLKKLKI